MSDTLKICALGILCATCCVVIKTYQSGFIVPIRIAGILLIFGVITFSIGPIIVYLKKIMGMSISVDNASVIIKAISIAYITQITSEICSDCGESSLARGVDTVGKMEILILGLPLIEDVIKLSEELLS